MYLPDYHNSVWCALPGYLDLYDVYHLVILTLSDVPSWLQHICLMFISLFICGGITCYINAGLVPRIQAGDSL